MTLESSPITVQFSAPLTIVHVVPWVAITLESGTIPMDQWCLIVLLGIISTEVEQTIKLYI